jgi:hypothetical protein
VRFSGTHNRTYLGWINHDGVVQVRYYDHTTKLMSAAVDVDDLATIDADEGPDSHNSPSIYIDSNGYINVFYFIHDKDGCFYKKRSTNVEDISAWDSRQTIDAVERCNYPQPFKIGSTLWLFYRVGDAGDSTINYRTSADEGLNWSAATTFIDFGSSVGLYHIVASGGTTIHVAYTKKPADILQNVYYIYSSDSGSNWKKRDGTGVSVPIDESESDLVYNSGSEEARVLDIVLDASYNPYIAFSYKPSQASTLHTYRFAKYDAGWSTYAIYSTYETDKGVSVKPVVALDPNNQYRLCGGKLETVAELQIWTSSDNGATWAKDSDVTTGSRRGNFYMQWVKNYADALQLTFNHGDWEGLAGGQWTEYDKVNATTYGTIDDASVSTYRAWNRLVNAVKHRFQVSCDVTRRELALGSSDWETGWRDKIFYETTIKMVVVPRGATKLAVAAGSYPRLDAVGLTRYLVEDGDEIVYNNVYYEVKAVTPVLAGDKLIRRECDLTVLSLHE